MTTNVLLIVRVWNEDHIQPLYTRHRVPCQKPMMGDRIHSLMMQRINSEMVS